MLEACSLNLGVVLPQRLNRIGKMTMWFSNLHPIWGLWFKPMSRIATVVGVHTYKLLVLIQMWAPWYILLPLIRVATVPFRDCVFSLFYTR